jgi:N-acetylglutamate synthase-like GNAT family acetyltransferase
MVDGEVVVRVADRGDALAVAALLAKAFDEQRDQFTDEAFAASTPEVDAVAERIDRHRVWVAEWNGRIVGTVTAEVRSRSGWVRSLAVEPDARGLRLAARLLAAVEDHAIDHDLTALELTTTSFQTAAAKVYERLGFQPIGHENVLGTEMIRMRKPLPRQDAQTS